VPENTFFQWICNKYRLEGDSEFDPEEMEKTLREFDKKFSRINIKDALKGWELIEFTEEGFTLRLNERGIRNCQEHDKET